MDYWSGNMKQLGSKQTLQLMGDAINGSSGKTGQFAEMDPEEVRRAGNRMNEALGMGDEETQKKVVEDAVFTPFTNLTRSEISNGTITAEDGAYRMMQMMMNVNGAETEEDIDAMLDDVYTRLFGGKKK
jgi:hypothetical protein